MSKKVWVAGEQLNAADLNANFNFLKIFSDLLAGETIDGATSPVPVFIGDGNVHNTTALIDYYSVTGDSNVYGANWICQTFTTDANTNAITGVSIYIEETGVPSGNATISLYAVDGSNKPTGAALGSKSITANLSGSPYSGYIRFDFATPITVSPSTKYAAVVSLPSSGASDYWNVYYGNNPYAGGEAGTSSDSGSTWTMNTNDYVLRVYGGFQTTAGKVYQSDANNNDRRALFGFAISSADADESIEIVTSGKLSGFTGLTAGSTYYVSDTIGTISSTIGTTGIKVGLAVSTTEILLDKRKSTSGFLSRATTDATLTIHHMLGVVPSMLKLTCIYGGAPTLAVMSVGSYDGAFQKTIFYYDNGSGSPALTGGYSESLIGKIDDESASGEDGTTVTASALGALQATLTFTTGGGDTSQPIYIYWEAFE